MDAASYALPDGLADRVLSPALLVDLSKVRHNLKVMVALMGGDASRWRPHLKTTKMPCVWVEALKAGVRHFKVATTREAEVLLRTVHEHDLQHQMAELDDAGDAIVDVLVAYPLVGPAMTRAGQLAEAYPRARVSVLVECEAGPCALLHVSAAPYALFALDESGAFSDDKTVTTRLRLS